MDQRTPEWFAARLGKVTASRISDIIAKTQSGYSASRANYMALLICERLTGAAAESYSNAAMQHGTDTEPMALSAYEAAKGVLVQAEGFVTHPSIEQSGASPDGLVGDSGLIEIKCPNTATHLDTLLAKKMHRRIANGFARPGFRIKCLRAGHRCKSILFQTANHHNLMDFAMMLRKISLVPPPTMPCLASRK